MVTGANQVVATLERLRGDTAVGLLAASSRAVDANLTAALASAGAAVGGIRVVYLRMADDDTYVDAELEWQRAGEPSSISARYHRTELPALFECVLAGRPAWATRSDGETSDSELATLIAEEGTSGVLVVPGRVDGKTTGVLAVDYKGDEPVFEPDLVDAVQRFADLVAGARAAARRGDPELDNLLHRRQRLESLGVLAGGVAHDFNNVLQVVEVYGRFAFDAIPHSNPTARGYGEEVLAAAERAADLTRRLLVFSSEDAPVGRAVQLGPELARIVELARRLVPESVAIESHTAADFDSTYVRCASLDQAVLNLINNAADAMPVGTIQITGEMVTTPGHDHPHACLRVRDSGTGMDAATLERACDPFFTTKSGGKGTGLGLAMVHGMAEKAGGQLLIDSVLDGGTTVTLCLPEVGRGPLETDEPDTAPSGGDETVLVVEDDGIVRRVARTLLQDAGYRVVCAANGAQAAARLAEVEVDLVVSDVVMPIAGGRRLFDHVQERSPGTPFVFCSGYTAGGLGPDVLAMPRCAFVAKPYTRTQLLAAVRRLLDAR